MPRARFKFIVFRDHAGQWRWRLVSSNGKVVADCGEGYRHRGDALRIVEAIRGGATAGAPVHEPEAVLSKMAAVAAKPAAKRAAPRMAAKRASLSPATKRVG
jgi:uncharacterized protein YegP (UPF0339 family)